MNEDTEKKLIAKCWACEKKLYHNDEFVVIRWTPSCIGSYCHECNANIINDDD